MVKIPEDALGSPEFTEQRTQFLHDYAALLMLWAEFELAIEFKISKLTGMNPKDASIVIGGLSFGCKPSILYSLLDQRGDQEIAPKVRAVIDHARRNALVHGSPASVEDEGRFVFFKREVNSAYVVKHLDFTAETFNAHWMKFRTLETEALAAMDISDEDLEEYARAAGLFEPTPPRPQGRPRGEANGDR